MFPLSPHEQGQIWKRKKKKQFYLILQQLSELTPRNKNIDIDKKLVSLVFLYQAQISKRKKNNTFTHNPH